MKLEDYYALEQAIPKRLILDNELPLSTIAGAIYDADFQKARELVEGLTLDTSTSLDLIKSVFKLSFNYGGHLVDKNYQAKPDPQLLDLIIYNFCLSLEQTTLATIKLEYMDKIDKAEAEYYTVKKDDAKQDFIKEFVSFKDPTVQKTKMISALHSSRLSTWGFTAECKVYGITEYELSAILDHRTSAYCRMINGTRFKVRDAEESVIKVLSSNPEDLKTVQPFPKQTKDGLEKLAKMTPEELTANNWHIPPFHPFCRTLCVVVGFDKKITDISNVQSIANNLLAGQEVVTADNEVTLATTEPTKEDYKNYQLSLDDKQAELLSSSVKTTVPSTLGAVTGAGNDFINLQNLDSLKMVAKTNSVVIDGVSRETLNLKSKKSFPSYDLDKKTITPNYTVDLDIEPKSITINKLQANNLKDPLGFFKSYMRNLIPLMVASGIGYLLYKADEITLPVLIGLGFTLEGMLSTLKPYLEKRLKALKSIDTSLDLSDFDNLEKIINSPYLTTDGIRFLMQYPKKIGGVSVGEFLLQGFTGTARLNVGNTQSLDLILEALK